MLHNVSDRMMHGLARRQIDKRHQLQGLLSTNSFGPATTINPNTYSPDASFNPNLRSSAATVASQGSMSTVPRGKIQRPGSPAANSMTSGSFRSSVNSASVPVAPMPMPMPSREKIPPPLPMYLSSNNSNVSVNGIKGAASPGRMAPLQPESTSRSPLYGAKIQSSIQTNASQKQQYQYHHPHHHQQQQQQQQQQQFDRDLNFSDDYNLSEKVRNTRVTPHCLLQLPPLPY